METPECEKLVKVQDKSNTIGGFLDWMQSERKICLHIWHKLEEDEYGQPVYRNREGQIVDDWSPPYDSPMITARRHEYERRQEEEGIEQRYVPDPGGDKCFPFTGSIESLLAEYYKIDLKKVEKEKQGLLREIREAHKEG